MFLTCGLLSVVNIMSRKAPALFVIFITYVFFFSPTSALHTDCQIYHREGNSNVYDSIDRKCSFKLSNQHLSRSECEVVEYTYESQECEELSFHSGSHHELSKLKLKYQHNYRGHRDNGLNIVFTENKWRHLKMRLNVRGGEMHRNVKEEEVHSFCQEFHLLSNVVFMDTATLYCDCPFFTAVHEDQTFDLKYIIATESEKESRNYIFKLPSTNFGLDSVELLIYVDVTNAPKVQVKWEAAPKHFEVKSYIMKAVNYETDHIILIDKIFATPDQDELFYNYELPEGLFYFIVEFEKKNCVIKKCSSRSTNIFIEIKKHTSPFYEVKLSPLTGACLALLIGVIFAILFVWWTLSCRPVVLIIYKRTLPFHIQAVVALAEYLKNNSHVDVKIDEVDIPKTKDQNPINWCQTTFKQSNFVIVISSPPQIVKNEQDRYCEVAVIGLELLARKIGIRKYRKKFFSVLLPYCEQKDIPMEALELETYSLMRDLDDMLQHIHGALRKYQVPGGSQVFRIRGEQLLQAFSKASEEVIQQQQLMAEMGILSYDPNDDELNKLLQI